MDYDELVQQLRDWSDTHSFSAVPRSAADAITKLRAERDALKDELRRTCEHLGLDQLLAERDALRARVAELTDELQIECAARQTALAERDALRALLKVAQDCIYSLDAREIYADELARIDGALKDKP